MSQTARIAFAGTPQFAVPALERLVQMGLAIPLVFTQPDRRAGRGRRPTASPVKRRAEELHLTVAQPARFTDPAQLAGWGEAPDLLLVVAYGRLLPRWLLDWPGRGCINIHASLLPRWRGAAPVQHALLAGDRRTGVSIMQIVSALDEGPVYAQRATDIGDEETAGELGARLARLGAELLGDVLPDILAGRLRAQPQPADGVSYARKIGKADAALDWSAPALELARRVRAFNPWPVAESRLSDGRRLRIWEAHALGSAAGAAPGVIEAAGPEGIDVATGRGTLRLGRVQPPSAKAMDAAAYLAAHSVEGLRFVC